MSFTVYITHIATHIATQFNNTQNDNNIHLPYFNQQMSRANACTLDQIQIQ